MTTLLFARHGQASFGKSNYDQLSDLGVKQSQLLGTHYANSQRQIDAIFCGSLKRQKDTATHFLEYYQNGFPNSSILDTPTLIEGLNEFDHQDVFIKYNPDFETKAGVLAAISKAPVPKVRLAELFNEAMLRWHSGDHDDDYVESWPQFNQRVQRALQQVIAEAEQLQAKNVLIVTSGGVIAAISASLLHQGSSTAYQINRSLINTGVTSVISKPDKTRLLSLNEHSHLYHQGESFISWQ